MGELVAGLDAGFLVTETSTMLWHVGGVIVLDPRDAPEPFSVDIVRRLVSARLDALEPFRKVVTTGPLGLLPRWSEAAVDVDVHVREADLGPDADLATLADYAARVAETRLDRHRPLWELHVVPRLSGDSAAIVAKVHHSLADGIGAVELIVRLLDLEARPAGPSELELPAAPLRPSRIVELPLLAARAGVTAVTSTVGAVRHVAQAGLPRSFAFTGPRTPAHAALTARRAVGLGSVPLGEVRSVKDRFGVSFNDVVLAVLTGALRRWLDDARQLPDRAVVAIVPTSVRSSAAADARARNQVSAMFVSLPVHLSDAAARVRAITADATRAKRLHEDAGIGTLGALGAVAPWRLLGAVWRASWKLRAAAALPPLANLLVTSVPGPSMALHLAGARVTGMYPLGPILEGIPLNITAVSREDRVEIGILACPDLVPDVTALEGHLPAALAELTATR